MKVFVPLLIVIIISIGDGRNTNQWYMLWDE